MSGHYLRIDCLNTYQAISSLVSFLTTTVGWVVAEQITDTGSSIDIVLSSVGEPEVPNGFPRYIRLQSATGFIVLFTYETFESVGVNTGELSDSNYGKLIAPNVAQGFEMMVVADLERVIINTFPYTGTTTYTGYVGRITPYHRANEHKYPNIVKGATSSLHTWYFSTQQRNSFMLGPHGSKQHYFATEPINVTGLIAAGSSDRGGHTTMSAPVIVNTDVDNQRSEIVGEPRGVYRVSPEVTQTGAFISIAGEVYVTFVQNAVHMVMGPIGTEIPPLMSDITI